MKFTIFASVIGLAFILGTPAYADSLTLDEYLSEVKDANPNIQSAQLHAKALANRIDPAGTLDDPFIAMGVDEVPFGGGSEHVMRYQVSQAIPFPGKLSAKSDVARSKANSAKSDADTLNREVTVIATQAYYRAYYNQKAIDLNGSLKKVISGTVASTKSRYETGDEGHHDLLLAKIELSSLEVDRLRLLREQKTLQAVINELRSKPAETPLGKLAVKFSKTTLKESDLPPLESQPEIKSLNSVVTQAEKEEKLAKLAYYPDFVVQGMAMDPHNMMDAKSNWGVMVGINIPLYANKKQSKLLSAAINDKEAALREKSSLENRLNTEMVAAREQFSTAKDVVGLYRNSVLPTTDLAVKDAKTSYISGKLALTEYLDTLKAQRTQQLEYLAAQIDVELARTRLKELLSAPPVLRLAPSKPSLFGSRGMSAGMGSDTVNMGDGMSGPTRKPKATAEPSDTGGAGMGGM